jgi:small-conductance mechanosensitive channel
MRLSKTQLLDFHTIRIERYGGRLGIASSDVLDRVLATPDQTLFGFLCYPTPVAKIAALVYNLVRQQPFISHNETTALLVLLLRGALRFLRVLLDGVAAGRVSSSWLAAAQAPVARPVLSVALVVVALPLVVAAAFGRFGTPLETLALTGSAVVFLAAVPVLAAAVVGLSVMWRGAVKVGDWVKVGDGGARDLTGEVTSLGLTGVVLVPPGGGTVVVPSLLLLVRPLRRIGDQPPTAIEIRVRRTQKIAAHVAVVEGVVRGLDEGASAVVVDADDASLLMRLSVSAAAAPEAATILRAVLVAVDEGILELAPRGG